MQVGMKGFVVTMDIEKAFVSLEHNFLISTSEKYRFGKNFILQVNILQRHQVPCGVNGGTTIYKYTSISHLEETLARVTQFQLFDL